MQPLSEFRDLIRQHHRTDEAQISAYLQERHAPSPAQRARITQRAISVVKRVRAGAAPTLMESFLGEYGLSSEEGLALMTLAEALLRVPDYQTMDRLIEDKIVSAHWQDHFGKSENLLVNASSYALNLSKTVLERPEHTGPLGALRGAMKRLGEPVIRASVRRAMQELGNQFVLGQSIEEALKRATQWEKQGATYSYDMLGEAAITEADAQAYLQAYRDAITAIAAAAKSDDVRENPGLSIKLSALFPRYEMSQQPRAIPELARRVGELALAARNAKIGLNIDAEEAHRLGLSLDMIELVLGDPRLAGWDGFGVVVQAFSKRASFVLDWLYALATQLDRRIMVRLVKGAYWDSEIKRAQMDGVPDFPVFTTKSATDISYICCANQLLGMTDRIYPQFATHNAHSAAAILELAGNQTDFEFQRLHGMGESLHATLLRDEKVRSRIYAPVGRHRELLAYLVRRLLENGANSSFVHKLANHHIDAEAIAADPFDSLAEDMAANRGKVVMPGDLYLPERQNSRGWDLANRTDLNDYMARRAPFAEKIWRAGPQIAEGDGSGETREIFSPADPSKLVGVAMQADIATTRMAIDLARPWTDCPPAERAEILRKAADLYEDHHGEIFALLSREAGKTPFDTIAELREAVDFLRYYAAQCTDRPDQAPRGVIGCISPWNFPLAIFTGQIAAALAAGNAVLAKPADQTPLIASLATSLLHRAGVPTTALQMLPGEGATVGAALASSAKIDGICFTGSTRTAQTINRTMADHMRPEAMLIAETGGLNCMIVDSTALPEQSVRDIITSAFQSAGQRCSALRMLYLHEDIAAPFLEMLFGAMDELAIGDPWFLASDIGPVIDQAALTRINRHVELARSEGRLLKQLEVPGDGYFAAPAVIEVGGIADLAEEIFGPVLHVATFGDDKSLDAVVAAINARGYGLTFGLQSRITQRVDAICSDLHVGNIYVNRNQVGAVVGTQPFGGEGLSGTGPKAGGPHYLPRFYAEQAVHEALVPGQPVTAAAVTQALQALPRPNDVPLATVTMPGATGESNETSLYPRGRVLCLGPSAAAADRQAEVARRQGCTALRIAPGVAGDHALDGGLDRALLSGISGFDVVVAWSDEADQRAIRQALAARDGALVPLVTTEDFADYCIVERHVCIDTTAAGGNVSLLS